ncbi:MAG: replication factor A [Haloquadratum sp. J07HQX50]|nr:MAG: replication factor A [Haloquadratum sp. J07HQX50]
MILGPTLDIMNIDEEAKELASALGRDAEDIKAELEDLVAYSVPIEEAKQSIRRKYTDTGAAPPESKDIAAITMSDSSVNVTARVLTAGKRRIQYQGDEQVIIEGRLADETSDISYTAWEDFGFTAGDSITVGNAGVREWEDNPELNLNQSSSVMLEDDLVDVPYNIGGESDIVDLQPGNRGRIIAGRILEAQSRTIDGRDGETMIRSGVIGDESGRLPFTDWQARERIAEGRSVRFEDVYIREFRGVPQINLSEFTAVESLDRDVAVNDEPERMSIDDAITAGGAFDIEIVGNVLEIREGSGLIERCPECGRVLQNNECRAHGPVDGEDDMRVKAIVDDGTGAVTAILDRSLTSTLYGGSMEDAKSAARDAMNKAVVADTIRERVVGREYCLRGNISVDEYGASAEAKEFSPTEGTADERAARLIEEVRA